MSETILVQCHENWPEGMYSVPGKRAPTFMGRPT